MNLYSLDPPLYPLYDRCHPKEMDKQEIERFLSHLAINRDVSSSTQNQALNAILFLYKHVLKLPVDMNIRAIRSEKPERLPTVLSKQEIQQILNQLSVIRKAIKIAVSKTNISKRVTTHVFRHSFATHLLEDGVNIHMVQTLLGHKDVKTTEIYTHVMSKSLSGIKSPL